MSKVIATWSGGKDSCFATYKALESGHSISSIANTISKEFNRVRFHGVTAEMIQTQAEAIGFPLLQQATDPNTYEEEFIANIQKGLSKEVEGIVFGDIHLDDCLAWAQKVSKALGLEAIEPLWHMSQTQILSEFISAGFEAIIVSTQADKLGKEWVGRRIDKTFLRDIKELSGVDLCGENGEYHSLVIDGPLFHKKVAIAKAYPIFRDDYWFLDIQNYHLVPK